MSIKSFEDLEVWKRSCQIAVDIYKALHSSTDFGLKDQMQRAAVSIAPNIAEGSERASISDYIRFLIYAKSSCGELRTQIYISQKIRIETNQEPIPNIKSLIAATKEISAMLQGLINSLKKSAS